ncbi:MAG: M28 family peptidase [Armatimonadetes bacterium]|nr:M28 family peptidase [Armatimonadota bacterium]
MMQVRFARAAAAAAALIVISGCGGRSQSPPFNEARAFEILKKQCAFGPRYAGTPGHRAAADYLRSELEALADEASEQTFIARIDEKPLEFRNIFAVFNPDASRFVLLCAHWDTRPSADEEVDPEKRKKPIIGANDGASGVAVLLELARAFRAKKPLVGVVIALFDGEDYGPTPDRMFLGSKQFARNWRTVVCPKGREISYEYGILLDMVGDKDLEIAREKFSVQAAPRIVEKVWSAAKRVGYGGIFVDEERYMVNDDHLPLLSAGIKCIDVIDFNYAHWHTLDDTVDKCSPKSLKIVGEVIGRVIYEEGAAKGD